MASLRAFLPAAGSTVWRNERRSTRTSSSGESEHTLSITRIKHIVIREVWKKNIPSPHAVYKIDVMTQSNHWFILRRYREFHSLHQNLVKQYGVPNDMLPSKTLSSNMALDHLEKRRNALEHYLQRLINSHHDIAESKELFDFLNVQTHDVLCVTRQLAKHLEIEGRNILASGSIFTFTPTQMYCITRQLQLPHYSAETSAEPGENEGCMDLGYLYSFIHELRSLCVSGVASRSSLCEELISNQAFDIAIFKSLEKLQIDKCHISVIDGLYKVQKQLTHVSLKNCVKTMKEFVIDCAMQKRAVNQANVNVEPWRNFTTTKLTENRVVVRPWFVLTHLYMSHNNIATLDHSLKLLPALEQLDLSFNDFAHLDLGQLSSSTLTFLNISNNNIHYISATTKDLANLKSLLLSQNKLQSLDGLDCLRGLVELDIRNNEVKKVEELAKISSLLHLRILALTGNPCVSSKTYRIRVFSQVKTRELILDGVKVTENEKKKVRQEQERKTKDLSEIAEPAPSTPQGQLVPELNSILHIDRDDDQDSGIEGNFAGSADDRSLAFDWCRYGNTETINRPHCSMGSVPCGTAQGTQGTGNDGAVVSRSEILRKPRRNYNTLLSLAKNYRGKTSLSSTKPPLRKNIGKSNLGDHFNNTGHSKFSPGLENEKYLSDMNEPCLVSPVGDKTNTSCPQEAENSVACVQKQCKSYSNESKLCSGGAQEHGNGARRCVDVESDCREASDVLEANKSCEGTGYSEESTVVDLTLSQERNLTFSYEDSGSIKSVDNAVMGEHFTHDFDKSGAEKNVQHCSKEGWVSSNMEENSAILSKDSGVHRSEQDYLGSICTTNVEKQSEENVVSKLDGEDRGAKLFPALEQDYTQTFSTTDTILEYSSVVSSGSEDGALEVGELALRDEVGYEMNDNDVET